MYDAPEYTPTNENMKTEALLSSSDDSSAIKYAADIDVHVSKKLLKRVA